MQNMLGLPLTSVLLPSLFLQADGLALMPLVIVAVTVACLASARLAPESKSGDGAAGGDSQRGARRPTTLGTATTSPAASATTRQVI
jgi:hypothetical protein